MPFDLIADVCRTGREGEEVVEGEYIGGTAHEIIPSISTNGEVQEKKEVHSDLADAGTFMVGLEKLCARACEMWHGPAKAVL